MNIRLHQVLITLPLFHSRFCFWLEQHKWCPIWKRFGPTLHPICAAFSLVASDMTARIGPSSLISLQRWRAWCGSCPKSATHNLSPSSTAPISSPKNSQVALAAAELARATAPARRPPEASPRRNSRQSELGTEHMSDPANASNFHYMHKCFCSSVETIRDTRHCLLSLAQFREEERKCFPKNASDCNSRFIVLA